MKKLLFTLVMLLSVGMTYADEKVIPLSGGTAAQQVSADKTSGTFTFTGGEFQTIFQAENTDFTGFTKVRVEFEDATTVPVVMEFKTSNNGTPGEVIGGQEIAKGSKEAEINIPAAWQNKVMPYFHVIHMGYDNNLLQGEEAVVKVKKVELIK
jgi:hypothetical protein